MANVSVSAKLVGALVARAVVPVLKPLGFKRSGSTFRREQEQCIQVVNVQSSQWNSQDEAKFTVNLGVFFPAIHAEMADLLGRAPSASGPTEYQCQVRTRIGRLLPDGQDKWWSLRPGEPAERTVAEVEEALRGAGVRWFERYQSASDLLRAPAEDGAFLPPIAVIAAAIVAGDREAARRIAREIDRAPDTEFQAWLTQRGLL